MQTGHREINGHSWSDFPNIYEKEKKYIKKDSVPGPWSKKHSKWIALGGINKGYFEQPPH
jgi:hypothetical protein